MSRKPYPKYKPSGVPWLEEIPTNWQLLKIKHISSINDDTLSENSDPNLKIRYVDIGSVDCDKGIVCVELFNFLDAPSRARRLVKFGDVIISTVRTYLRAITYINKSDSDLVVSTGFAVVRPKNDFAPEYASFVLKSSYFVENVVANSVGVSYPAISPEKISNITIPLPSEEEQSHISNYLFEESDRIDGLVEKKKRQIELLKEKRSALISRAVTRGLDPSVPLKPSGVPWLGSIPSHWEVNECKFNYSIQLGKMLQNESESEEDVKVPYLKALNVQWGKVDIQDMPEMWASRKDCSIYNVENGDLLVCEGGEVGRASIISGLDNFCIIQNALHRVKSKYNNSNKYLYYVLMLAGLRGWFDIICNKATIAHFTGEKFSSFVIALPPHNEQRVIVIYLDTETSKIDSLIEKIESSIELLKEYRTSLISACVTGNIDIRKD